MTTLRTVSDSTTAVTQVNDNFKAVSAAGLYGYNAFTTTGLYFGYYGGRAFGNTIADSAVLLTASTTNYVVANRSTGAVTASTGTANWTDTTNYLKLFSVVTGSASILSYVDERQAYGGAAGGGGGGMTNPMTAAGDIIYGGTSGTPTRLAVGTNGYVLTLASGVPTWAASAGGGGFSNPMTTVGDLIVGGTSGAAGRLAAGTSGYVLTSTGAGSAPTWQAAAGGGGGSLTNWTEAVNSATPNATRPVVSFVPNNAATDVDVALVPKTPSSSLLADIPDNTTAGGNKRGIGAVDWQFYTRSNADKVASGQQSTIGGGQNNKASGTSSTIPGGDNNTAGGTGAFSCGSSNNVTADYGYSLGVSNSVTTGQAAGALGQQNIVSGASAVCLGYKNQATGTYSTVIGARATDRGIQGAFMQAGYDDSNSPGATNNHQIGRFLFQAGTSNATPTVLNSMSSNTVNTTGMLTCPVFTTIYFDGFVTARGSGAYDCVTFKISGMMSRDGGNVAFVGTPTVTSLFATAGASSWTLGLTVNTTSQCLVLTATGVAALSIRWGASIDTNEVSRS